MEKKLGLSALTALVLSSMLGAGVFSLPQNMAAVASPSALLIGWAITGVGILFLAFAMLLLTRIRPDLDGGIFTYAREGFGELIGFCSAWGYWLCAVIANVSYLVIVFSALSFFTDTPELRLFGDGNTWQSIVGASVLLWVVHFLVLRGVQTAAGINLVATLAKLLPLGAFVALAALAFQLDTFRLDFSGLALGVPVWEQVKNTMLITLWVFIGVEGAVVVSARARHKRDVGRATLLAVLSALAVYLLVTLLSLGVVPRSELAEMRNPSMAGLMVRLMGSWGEIVIAAGLIVSVCGAYLSWTIMAAEVPYLAATHKAFPRLFARQNCNNAPSASLWLTNISVQASLVLIWLTGSDYGTLLTIASEMILVPYLLVGAFLLKIATRPLHQAVGIGACIYGLWLLYASGPVHLLLSVVLYAPGLLVFLYARRTHQHDRSLKRRELALIGLLLVAAVPATWMLVG
ncbi:amino acid permease [Klebsiella quasipneumoniae subsp. similipneumoniae]|uniref:amino acid permease n=2 Tax=Klebsiella quasipneumoniae TaxID=1463165 RepID=UPI001251AE7D|nr:amino acid permease [Klebsiella quasipneumoniae]EKU6355171.1 amino acid permease [Klebsiella quasipneumoniae]MCB3001660.1 amino acid permease [Klebsiella quasipneumoniae]NHJ26485.1 amino acid permease [Klebsiella quasipneumoniae subsp. similipneumoniae]NHJ50943.1 amino acid permease [Klebsiella quasipneumoniae subsp. similipneumoniae]NHJ65732.1 amino acid permease [Klebsiella quasipneumoniae subsp. similipneumoniae]